jgi:hypothetical protein
MFSTNHVPSQNQNFGFGSNLPQQKLSKFGSSNQFSSVPKTCAFGSSSFSSSQAPNQKLVSGTKINPFLFDLQNSNHQQSFNPNQKEK